MKPIKKKYKLSPAILAAILALQAGTLPAHADGAGVRGGGLTVEAIGGGRELYDLKTRHVNSWITAEEMNTQVPEFKVILNELAKLDWYFAYDIERELQNVMFNMTGALFTDPRQDPYTFVLPDLSPRKQVAYRLYSDVYVDEDEFNRLKPRSKGYLVTHELMHSYLPMNTFDRYTKLVSMVKTIWKVVEHKIVTTKALHLQMSKNDIDFPLTSTDLAAHQTQIKFLLNDPEVQKATLLAAVEPEDLITFKNSSLEKVKGLLARWDRDTLNSNPPLAIFSDVIADVIRRGTDAEVDALIAKPFKLVNPALIAASMADELGAARLARVLSSDHGKRAYQEIFNQIEGDASQIEIIESRIAANDGVRMTAGPATPYALQNILTLPAVKKESDLNQNILGWAQLIVIAIKNNQIDFLRSVVGENDSFYSAFTLAKAKAQVNGLNVPVEREKQYVFEKLSELGRELSKVTLRSIRDRVTPEQFKTFEQLIHKERLNLN